MLNWPVPFNRVKIIVGLRTFVHSNAKELHAEPDMRTGNCQYVSHFHCF